MPEDDVGKSVAARYDESLCARADSAVVELTVDCIAELAGEIGRPGFRGPAVRALRVRVVVLAPVVLALTLAGAATAQGPAVPLGYDISYPQCNTSLPTGAAFAIVGVNDGLPFSPNPCLGGGDGPSELQWAGPSAQLYANTADPGPALSSHWPNGQTAPQQCNTVAAPGADTSSCAYDYGWNAALDSYQDVVNADIALGLAPAGSTRTPSSNLWWLDVESANSWEANTTNNVAELQGEVDSLKALGVTTIGFYAPAANWQTITGASTQFASFAFWLPGTASLTDAQSRCSEPAPNGGVTSLVQFQQATGTADINCSELPVLAFATTLKSVEAGEPAGPLVVALPTAPAEQVTISLTSTSPTARFATHTAGPWTLTVTVPTGATQTSPVYYRDTTIGAPLVRATADGYITATQTETVRRPACSLPTQHDRGFEIALTHARTQSSAARVQRDTPVRIRGRRLPVKIERDGCTDFELAVGNLHTRASALCTPPPAPPTLPHRHARAPLTSEAAVQPYCGSLAGLQRDPSPEQLLNWLTAHTRFERFDPPSPCEPSGS